jgi:hypothetical protein
MLGERRRKCALAPLAALRIAVRSTHSLEGESSVHAPSPDRSVLIYRTDDSAFADSAIDALTDAGIDCYRTRNYLPPGSRPPVCIYIRSAGDYVKANAILVKHGAAVNPLTPTSEKIILAAILIGALLVAIIIVEFAK